MCLIWGVKMGLFRTVMKTAFGPAMDVKSWVGYSQLKNNTKSLFFWVKELLFLKKARRRRRKETFEQAVKRTHITEENLIKRSNYLLRHIYIYVGMAFLCFIYAFYLIFKTNILAGILTIMIAVYLVTRAYVAHFWCFEIKNRKLGCNFKEWLHGDIKKEQQEKGVKS